LPHGRQRSKKWDTFVASSCLERRGRRSFESGPVRFLGVNGGLLWVGSSEQRHQLMFARTGFGTALGAELAQPMR
jgi:hypothetical protein